MYLADQAITTVNLQATNPLLWAGLERAVELAHLEVMPDKNLATLSLRSAGAGAPHPHLDMAVDVDRIVISIAQRPSEPTWTAIYSLLCYLTEGFRSGCDE